LDTIQQIGVTGIPIVTALNKIDLLEKDELQNKILSLNNMAPNAVPVSTLKGTNIETLKQEITRYLVDLVQASFSVKINDDTMALVSQLFNRSHVQNVEYNGEIVNVVFKSIPWLTERVKGRVEKQGGIFSYEL
jgi:GTP-binding protein HflX